MSNGLWQDDSTSFGPPTEHAAGPGPSPRDFGRHDWLKRQQAVVAIGRRAITSPTLSILIQDAAALIAEMLDLEHYATAEPWQGETMLVTLNLAQPDRQEHRALTREISKEGSSSLAGRALQTAHLVAVNDMAEEQRFEDLFLAEHRVRGAIAVPLITHDETFGVLIACGSRACCFEREDLLFVETVAHLVTTTIARCQTEKVLAAERQLTDGVLQAVGALVLTLDVHGRINHINRACEQAIDFSLGDIKGRPIWSVFAVPSEAERFRLAFGRLAEGASRIEHESALVTKHADKRRIAWSCAAVRNAEGAVESIIATGIDITGQREAEQRAERAEQEVEAARATQDEPPNNDERFPLPGHEYGAVPAPWLAMMKKADRQTGPDRRRRPRRSYPYRQLVAPIVRGKLPARSEFIRVCCNDIAAGGFSYLASEPPPADALIVALGNPPDLTYVAAQVVHVTRVKRKGTLTYLVGCTYTGRARY